ncbi:peroxisomal membrane protein [Sporothrix brasiliensis 5110]|uniref:Peroxisomal membrane protein n=1 Tax=Sporothrix brasiliensis 5110 TaxID=1398154 RepID=A0A0C2IUW7_9PEZI|nr:peroxisomal membrane protein [Sporothrix brasiliensis 5110]KIH90595.1 peroxisomal membrane protein [Sporothrix brasiliensis 5110]
MATERLLKTTLALYHDGGHPHHPQPPSDRIFASTTSLLTTLTNPLNVTLLTSHFLTAPAIWGPLAGPAATASSESAAQTCFRVVSVFNTAGLHVRRHELEEAAAHRAGLAGSAAYRRGVKEDRRPGSEDWARAVAQGADGKSPRWRHLLVLVGVLLGLGGGDKTSPQKQAQTQETLSRSRRAALEQGVVAAANLALAEHHHPEDPEHAVSRYAVVMGLNYALSLLSEHARANLQTDALLPAIADVLAGPFGFDGGRIVEAVARDPLVSLQPPPNSGLHWPEASGSFQHLRRRETQQALSIVASAGPLATMAAFAVERAASPQAVLVVLDALLALADSAGARWTAARILHRPALAPAEGAAALLSAETAQTTWPLLWQHLKKILYTAAVVLQAIVGRSLLDRALASDSVAPQLAVKALRVLHGLDFVASHDGAGHFQAYQFAYLASIDILARYPRAAAEFLSQLVAARPPATTATTDDPLRLTSDLFYLNLAEHFAAVLPVEDCDRLLIQPALPYVAPATVSALPSHIAYSPRMVEVFEAAHSATLSVLSCPHNAAIAAALGPVYAEALFASFPARISARQFRLAFKTLIQILSPPFPVYATHPDLAETLLEMVRFKALGAATVPLPANPSEAQGEPPLASSSSAGLVTEQSALVLTLIDALPFLALPVLEEWMTTAAETIWCIQDAHARGGPLRQAAQRRFWEVLGGGEMDVERAAIGVAWWGNGGGGELVLTGQRGGARFAQQRATAATTAAGGPVVMSGALPGPPANKL